MKTFIFCVLTVAGIQCRIISDTESTKKNALAWEVVTPHSAIDSQVTPHHRRRGLVPKWRRRGDLEWNYTHGQKLQGPSMNESVEETLSGDNDTVNILVRRKRWYFLDIKDVDPAAAAADDAAAVWALEDDYRYNDEKKQKETDLEKFAKQWQKHALKCIFLFSFCAMIVCCCCACCKKMVTRLYEVVCWHCRDWRDICLNRDPSFRRARQFADDYGIKLDYEQYQNIKSGYEDALDHHGYGKVDLSGR